MSRAIRGSAKGFFLDYCGFISDGYIEPVASLHGGDVKAHHCQVRSIKITWGKEEFSPISVE
jgi:hypothetical protein